MDHDRNGGQRGLATVLTTGPARVWALTAALGAVAAALSLGVLRHLPAAPGPLRVPWPLLAVAFAATEVFVVHVHFRREAHSISLSEIPLVAGLFFVSPLALVVARVVGAAPALLLHRRQAPLKAAFNLVLFAVETAAAAVAFSLVIGDRPTDGASGWAGGFAATFTAHGVAALAIAAAVSLLEGRRQGRMLVELLQSGVAATANTSLALVAVIVVGRERSAAWLLLVMSGVLFFVYRAYASLHQRYAKLELLYGFTRSTGRASEAESTTSALLAQVREVLRAEVAELTVHAENGQAPWRVTLGPGEALSAGPADAASGAWWRDVASGRTVRLARPVRDEDARRQLASRGWKDAMAAPLRGESGVVATLVVASRLGDVSTFDGEDQKLFGALANHAGVALENGRLVDRLRREAADKEHQALHDALTGLPNRRLFAAEVERAVAEADGTAVAVMLLDLDRFKEVNDTLGHRVGDVLLAEVGRRLSAAAARMSQGCPPGADPVVARLGGDEFAVALPVAGVAGACAAAEEMLVAVGRPFEVSGLTLEVSASLGIALSPDHGEHGAVLLQRADVAMYDAKTHSGRFEVYAPERDQYSPRRLALVGELRRALEAGELILHYQPKAELADGRVAGVEALVRWVHPRHGFVPPDEFIPLAEHTGLIRPLTHHVLRTALAQCAAWRRAGLRLDVAVNLSPRNLADNDLPADVARLLAEAGVEAAALTLEITETSVMADPTRTLGVLEGLFALGVTLSIDDFGTGYSSLAYLKRLPVGEVKIDRSFVTAMADDDAAIVRSTIDLGHNLGLSVVAEGVEDAETWKKLRSWGCDTVQGYHLSRPLPPGQLVEWLASRPAGSAGGLPAASRRHATVTVP